jgi:hypothetical protein
MNEKKNKKTHFRGIWWWGYLCCTRIFVFWKTSTIQNVHIGICREYHGLSKYVITFLKMLFYDDDIPKIQCLTYFFQADIRKVVKQGVVVNIVLVKNDHYSSFHAFSLCKSLNFDWLFFFFSISMSAYLLLFSCFVFFFLWLCVFIRSIRFWSFSRHLRRIIVYIVSTYFNRHHYHK